MRSSFLPRRSLAATGATLALLAPLLGQAAPAYAAATEVVTEDSVTRQIEDTPPTDAWVLYTRTGTPPTAGAFVSGPGTPPMGTGSLRLETQVNGDKVYLFNFEHVGTALGDIDEIGYSTHRSVGTNAAVAALNLQVDFNGDAAGGFTTLVFEPYQNADQQAIVNNTWQDWTATGTARWWSTRDINGQCARTCLRSWDQIVADNPDAEILGGVGINQGSYNPGVVSHADAFTFDETTYDFEKDLPDSDGDGIPGGEDTDSKEDCKDGGWQRFTNPVFRNQGECVSYFAKQKH